MKAASWRTLTTLGAVLWLAAPIAGLVLLTLQDRSASLADTVPALVPVRADNANTRIDVDLALTWQAPTDSVAPQWSGTVQQTLVTAGDSVTNGAPIVIIDGITRIAWQSPGSFYRPIGDGAKGLDVTWLKAILASTGAAQTTNDRCDRACLRGVRQLASSIGVPSSQNLAAFDPGWIVPIPKQALIVESVTLVTGALAAGQGTPILTYVPELASAQLVTSGSLDSVAAEAGEGEPVNPQIWSNAITASLLTAPVDATLIYQGIELSMDTSRTAVVLDQLPRSNLSDDTAILPVALSVAARPDQLLVPASAIRAAVDGATCVFIQGMAVPVEVVRSDAGLTTVTGEIAVGQQVASPPPQGASCQST